MKSLELGRYALASCAVVALLTGCGRSQPPIGAPGAGVQPATRAGAKSFHGYYLAKFTHEVGSTLTFSSVCLRFTSSSSGSGYNWSSVPPTTFVGTYLISGNTLFASAIAPWSPNIYASLQRSVNAKQGSGDNIYASLQGSVNAKQGSGDYIVMQPNGDLYSGGAFTMTRAQKGCS